MYRIGYGDYEKKVRVARLSEEMSSWSSGRWVGTDQCFKLDVGDRLLATCDCSDSSHDENILTHGGGCVYKGGDADGDVILAAPTRRYVIFYQDLEMFSLQ